MKKLIVAILSVSSLAIAGSHAVDRPKLEFPSRQLMDDLRDGVSPYILNVLDEHEREFPGAMRYREILFYTPLERLARVQQSVLLALHKQTDFAKKWQAREKLVEITATVSADSKPGKKAAVLSQSDWDWKITQLRLLLRDYVEGYRDKEAILESLRKGVKKNLKKIKDRGSDAYKSADDRLLIALYVIVSRMLTDDPTMGFLTMYHQLEDMGVGLLDYLHDPAAYTAALAALERPAEAKEQLEMVYREINDQIYKTGDAIQLKSGQTLKLKEVHPNIAIFRGYVGNDCSTSFSPGFVFTPTDRYFYVFDEKDKSLGYLGLSLVTIEGKPAVFIHTIQGPDFTAEQTEIVMRAMTRAAPHIYGTELVVLGPDASISSNVNFHTIRRTMMDAVSGKPSLKMTFPDLEMRKLIATYGSTMQYDDPEKNHSGRRLEFSEPDILNLSLVKKDFDAKFYRPILAAPADPASCDRWARR